MQIPFPPFEPDRSPFYEGGTDAAVNALPVADGWGPFPSFQALSDSLGAECRGAIAGRSTGGDFKIFAFTATGIFQYNQGAATWTDISGASAPYNLADDEYWSILQFGPYIVASNIADPMQVFDLDGDTEFSDLSGNPPKSKYIWVCGGYLFAGNTEFGADRIYNAALEDIGNWTIGEKGADFQPGGGSGEVVGGIGDQFGGYVFYSDRVRKITLTSSTGYTYSLTDVNTSRPTVSPYSIVAIGPNDFIHYCEDGWFRGPNSQPIGAQRVDQWFRETADIGAIRKIQGTFDPVKKMAWFTYPKAAGGSGVLGYNWQLDRWTTLDNAQTYLVPLATAGFTLDDIAALYPSIEDVPYSFDSYVWAGGRPSFAGFSADGTFGFYSGGNMAVTLETGLIQHNPPSRAFVNGVRAITDAATHTVAVGSRALHSSVTVWNSATSPNAATGICPARSESRLHKYKVSIPASEVWNIVTSVDVDAVAAGAR